LRHRFFAIGRGAIACPQAPASRRGGSNHRRTCRGLRRFHFPWIESPCASCRTSSSRGWFAARLGIVGEAVSFPYRLAELHLRMAQKIVLGTRGSELARAQANLVEKAIQSARAELKIEIKIVATKGDEPRRSPVTDPRRGRKGLFTAEIERALLAGDVDVAVHSAKDLPSKISPGAEIAAALPRALTDDV